MAERGWETVVSFAHASFSEVWDDWSTVFADYVARLQEGSLTPALHRKARGKLTRPCSWPAYRR